MDPLILLTTFKSLHAFNFAIFTLKFYFYSNYCLDIMERS
jgi:hypothetical protein